MYQLLERTSHDLSWINRSLNDGHYQCLFYKQSEFTFLSNGWMVRYVRCVVNRYHSNARACRLIRTTRWSAHAAWRNEEASHSRMMWNQEAAGTIGSKPDNSDGTVRLFDRSSIENETSICFLLRVNSFFYNGFLGRCLRKKKRIALLAWLCEFVLVNY